MFQNTEMEHILHQSLESFTSQLRESAACLHYSRELLHLHVENIPRKPLSLSSLLRPFASLLPESFWMKRSAYVWPNFDPF